MTKMLSALMKIASTALVASSFILPASPAKSAELGGLDLYKYCQFLYPNTNASSDFDKKPGNVKWYCQNNRGFRGFIDMQKACTWQYKRVDAMPQLSRAKDPYSWRCYGQGRLIR